MRCDLCGRTLMSCDCPDGPENELLEDDIPDSRDPITILEAIELEIEPDDEGNRILTPEFMNDIRAAIGRLREMLSAAR